LLLLGLNSREQWSRVVQIVSAFISQNFLANVMQTKDTSLSNKTHLWDKLRNQQDVRKGDYCDQKVQKKVQKKIWMKSSVQCETNGKFCLKVILIASIAAIASAVPVYSPVHSVAYAPAAPAYAGHAYAHAPVAYAAPAVAKVAYAPAPAVYAAPVVKKIVAAAPEPYDPNPSYNFNYGVSDPHTGDSKTAEEHLENGVVHGSYSLTEADGTIRKVTYTADDHNGFNAQVERIGAPAVVKKVVAAPAVYAAPVVKQVAYAAPAYQYAAPAVAKVAYAAPAYAHAAPAYYHH
jgi:Insect cuticle protein